MATRLVRLPRLTLFSGPNCSLCDIAKAELAKVRQTVRTVWDIATIRAGNCQHPGPRAGEVEEEIRLLDSGAPSGGQGDRQGPVGRTDDNSSSGQLAEAEGAYEHRSLPRVVNIEPDLFFVDTGTYANWQPGGIYVRASETVLGDEESPDVDAYLHNVVRSVCFNCGEPTHLVNACPKPINRQLVSLSRDLHAFIKAEHGAMDYKRIHEVEEWRQQRLEFLDIFVPGEIRGAELRDALGGQDGDWLENMAFWGYPNGWVGSEDPRDKIREIIWSEYTDEGDQTSDDFFIYIGDDIVEKVNGNGNSDTLGDEENASETEDEEAENGTADTASPKSTTLTSPSSPPQPQCHPIRWATYPPSHFSSQLLPVYNGFMLPPISHQGSSTYTAERHALWQKIVSGKYSSPPPPPPDTEPPPLPPSPPPEPPSPLPRPPSPSVTLPNSSLPLVQVNGPDDDDMEISDVD